MQRGRSGEAEASCRGVVAGAVGGISLGQRNGVQLKPSKVVSAERLQWNSKKEFAIWDECERAFSQHLEGFFQATPGQNGNFFLYFITYTCVYNNFLQNLWLGRSSVADSSSLFYMDFFFCSLTLAFWYQWQSEKNKQNTTFQYELCDIKKKVKHGNRCIKKNELLLFTVEDYCQNAELHKICFYCGKCWIKNTHTATWIWLCRAF